MNAFLRNIEAQRLRERDEQMATLRGCDLPKGDHGKPDTETRIEGETERDLRTQRALFLLKEDPEISNAELAFELSISRTTLQTMLKAAGVKRVTRTPNEARQAELKKRQASAQQLRDEGLELEAIAQRLGCTERQVRYVLSGGR